MNDGLIKIKLGKGLGIEILQKYLFRKLVLEFGDL
ncbi:MAG: hypothetical protein ACJA0S_001130 [Rickettsiales bacterium]